MNAILVSSCIFSLCWANLKGFSKTWLQQQQQQQHHHFVPFKCSLFMIRKMKPSGSVRSFDGCTNSMIYQILLLLRFGIRMHKYIFQIFYYNSCWLLNRIMTSFTIAGHCGSVCKANLCIFGSVDSIEHKLRLQIKLLATCD